VILEPQAVADLVGQLMYGSLLSLAGVEVDGGGPWELGYDQGLEIWRTKLGLKVIDERLTITSQPFAPNQGVMTGPGLDNVTWFERGVLTNLSYRRAYGKETRKESRYVVNPGTYQMSGGTTTIDEMIASTKRGLLITRFSNLSMLHLHSLLLTGFTRDGLWLIENGKISRAVNNMRITESPLFVLNQIEQLGVPVPVFQPITRWKEVRILPTIVPPLKARDFSFTSTIDAV
jgi:predicted Zn-dependent protease